jgi:hypothetical protein
VTLANALLVILKLEIARFYKNEYRVQVENTREKLVAMLKAQLNGPHHEG